MAAPAIAGAGAAAGGVAAASTIARVPSAGLAGTGLRRNARVAYIGRVHPSLLASQERLDAIQAAIRNLESQVGRRPVQKLSTAAICMMKVGWCMLASQGGLRNIPGEGCVPVYLLNHCLLGVYYSRTTVFHTQQRSSDVPGQYRYSVRSGG